MQSFTLLIFLLLKTYFGFMFFTQPYNSNGMSNVQSFYLDLTSF